MGLDRLTRLQEEYSVEVETHAFFLRPDIQPGGRERQPREGEGANGELNEPLRTLAEDAGLTMRRSPHTPYTVPALEATEHAKQNGIEIPFHHAVYRAYWERGENIEQLSVLQAAAVEVGLDPEKLGEALRQQTHSDTVQQQYQEALSHGIEGIPAFSIGKYLFTGAQPYDF
ncbi:MAG: DsbA family protein, partial [Chloroflexota bacterium]|nr:DsbA family protein [Chloroflexota bacterium]